MSSSLIRFYQQRGTAGIHHVALICQEVEEELSFSLPQAGVNLSSLPGFERVGFRE